VIGLIQVTVGGLLQGGVFAMVALGFAVVYRVTGVVNLAQGAFCILGAMAMYFFQTVFQWPLPLALLAALASTVVAVTAIGAVSFVPAVSTLPNSGTLMLTAGLLTFFQGLVLVVWGSQPYALPQFSGEAPVSLLGIRLPSQGLWLLAACALMVLCFWYLLQRTKFGRALRACAENAAAAALMGIDVRGMMLASMALAAGIGALSGILIAPIMSLQFDTGSFFTNYGFIAVAIGGMGSFVGAVVGGLALGVVSQLAAAYASSLFANTLALVVLLAVIMLRPTGLFASGHARRVDVREEPRAHRALVRLVGRGPLGFMGLLVAGLLVLPLLPLPAGLLNSTVIALIFYIAVLGLDVSMGYAGQVCLGQAAFMAIGGYCAAILSTTYDWPAPVALVAALALSLACACVLSYATLRLRGHYLALATLAFGLLVDTLTVGLADLTGGPSGLVGIPSLTIGTIAFDTPNRMYYLTLGIAAIFVLLLSMGMRSDFGRTLQAVRADQTAAAALGIKVSRVKMTAFAIGAGMGSIAGSLYAFHFHFLSPEMVATPHSFELIAMLVLGGEGTLIGGLFGAVLLTLLPTTAQSLAVFKTMIEGALLVCVFRFLPEGLFGRFVILLERLFPTQGVTHSESRRISA
jgi:branched-chain amino acid transport system permease protein